ncbi:MAG: GIY-YIG nuclease family protein [Vicinamibacterales bacterium]
MESKQARRQAARDYREQAPDRGIFLVRSIATGEAWVGHSTHLAGAKNRLWFLLKSGAQHTPSLAAAWRARGDDDLSFEVLERLDPDVPEVSVTDLLKDRKREWAARHGATELLA